MFDLKNMILEKMLKKLIKEHDMKITDLAKSSNVPEQTIHNWLNGQYPRNICQVKCIADYFRVSIDKLCFGVETNNSTIEEIKNQINIGEFEVILKPIGRKI